MSPPQNLAVELNPEHPSNFELSEVGRSSFESVDVGSLNPTTSTTTSPRHSTAINVPLVEPRSAAPSPADSSIPGESLFLTLLTMIRPTRALARFDRVMLCEYLCIAYVPIMVPAILLLYLNFDWFTIPATLGFIVNYELLIFYTLTPMEEQFSEQPMVQFHAWVQGLMRRFGINWFCSAALGGLLMWIGWSVVILAFAIMWILFLRTTGRVVRKSSPSHWKSENGTGILKDV